MATVDGACIICLDTSPPPIQMGCACRGDSGLAHIDCLAQAAEARKALRDGTPWGQCRMCNQNFTGVMRMGLAEAWRSRVAGQPAESMERLAAESNLATALFDQGKHAEAELMLRMLLEVHMRVLGAEHPNTLNTAGQLAVSVTAKATKRQGNPAEAEAMNREVLGAHKRVLGAEHPATLTSTCNLAMSLTLQGKHAEAEAMNRELLGVQKRVLGADHPSTLSSAGNLAMSLSRQGKYADAAAIQREVLGVKTRVLGANHPSTLTSANNLAGSLFHQGKLSEAEQMLQAVLAGQQYVLGPTHPDTTQTANSLEGVRAHLRANPPTNAAAPTVKPLPLPAGTRVLVQRLVAKPEYNGKGACVLSFDGRTGRYAVALDDGKELSLKAECVAPGECPSE